MTGPRYEGFFKSFARFVGSGDAYRELTNLTYLSKMSLNFYLIRLVYGHQHLGSKSAVV